jgi:RNA polymerase sigma-54 factor
MKTTLLLKQSQHLVLTPQLQQSIRLLQLSTLELNEEIQQMLDENPFLEVEEELLSPGLESPAIQESSLFSELKESASDSASESEESIDEAQLDDGEREDWENGTEQDDFDGIRELPDRQPTSAEGSEDFYTERADSASSLQDSLRLQAQDLRLTEADSSALHMLIDSLDEEGYLVDSLEELAACLSNNPPPIAAEDWLEKLKIALKWLQQMDPVGIGARNLSECLMLQLRQLPRSQAVSIALLICKDHLDLLARRDMKKLSTATGADEELLREAHQLIMRLEPKPARCFSKAESQIIVPDVVVQKSGRTWRVVLNPEVLPRLRVNDVYAQALKPARKQAGIEAPTTDLHHRVQEARWFVRNVMQRFETILRVSEAIVDRQKNFFQHGAVAMKPLVLREIADVLGVHESTISRVTTAKYMATPQGTFELKYFFASSLNTDMGGSASSTAVKALIHQFIQAEDATYPLSDSHITELLAKQGIQVARRTVAKYREALKIPVTQMRRRES